MNTTTKRVLLGALILPLVVGVCLAVEPSKSTVDKKADIPGVQQSPFLGVRVEPLHPSVFAHLPRDLLKGQGVLVADIDEGSPAAEAGMKANDIVVSIGDQKIFSVEQMAKLIQADKVGDQVALGIIREGKPMNVKVALGTRTATSSDSREFPHWSWMPYWGWPHWATSQHSAKAAKSSKSAESSSPFSDRFDAMTIKSKGNDQLHVEIAYRDKDGKLEERHFDGTREAIEQDIKSQKDMPADEQKQLLQSLDMPLETEVPALFDEAFEDLLGPSF